MVQLILPFTELVDEEEHRADENNGHLFPVGAQPGGCVHTSVVFADKADPEREHGRDEETLSEVVYH